MSPSTSNTSNFFGFAQVSAKRHGGNFLRMKLFIDALVHHLRLQTDVHWYRAVAGSVQVVHTPNRKPKTVRDIGAQQPLYILHCFAHHFAKATYCCWKDCDKLKINWRTYHLWTAIIEIWWNMNVTVASALPQSKACHLQNHLTPPEQNHNQRGAELQIVKSKDLHLPLKLIEISWNFPILPIFPCCRMLRYAAPGLEGPKLQIRLDNWVLPHWQSGSAQCHFKKEAWQIYIYTQTMTCTLR